MSTYSIPGNTFKNLSFSDNKFGFIFEANYPIELNNKEIIELTFYAQNSTFYPFTSKTINVKLYINGNYNSQEQITLTDANFDDVPFTFQLSEPINPGLTIEIELDSPTNTISFRANDTFISSEFSATNSSTIPAVNL